MLCRTSLMSSEIITCSLWSKGFEWLGENLLITGQRDGKVKVWQLTSRFDNENDSETERSERSERSDKDKEKSSSTQISMYTLTHNEKKR